MNLSNRAVSPFGIIKLNNTEVMVSYNSSIFLSFNAGDRLTHYSNMSEDQKRRESESRRDAESSDNLYHEYRHLADEDEWEIVAAPLKAFSIKGLGERFAPKLGDVIYLQLNLDRALDIRMATVIYGPVGKKKESKVLGRIPGEPEERVDFKDEDAEFEDWPEYPELLQFLPRNIVDANGNIISRPTNQRQTKAYVLLGYTTQDYPALANVISMNTFDEEEGKSVNFGIVPCLNTNLLMHHYCSNGMHMAYPMPFIQQGVTDVQ